MHIKFISTQPELKGAAILSIRKYGCGPEHNYYHYSNLQEHSKKNIYVSFGKNQGILAQRDARNIWYTVDEVLAPTERKLQLFTEFVKLILAKEDARKIVTETTPQFRKLIRQSLGPKYSLAKVMYSLDWPVFELSTFDPQLRGRRWKKIRNLRNRLYKFHDVKVAHSKKIRKQQLLALLDEWIRKRFVRDAVERQRYENLINSGFLGCDYARSLIVDGKPATIAAGWKIPNSKDVYAAIGMLSYAFEGLGEASYIDELTYLRNIGYRYANFGGSDPAMLMFKKKFKPVDMYRTQVYSISKKKI